MPSTPSEKMSRFIIPFRFDGSIRQTFKIDPPTPFRLQGEVGNTASAFGHRGWEREVAVTNPANAKTAPEGAVSVFYRVPLSDQPANTAC